MEIRETEAELRECEPRWRFGCRASSPVRRRPAGV